MPIIVITGSTRGIGLGLAREFLERQCSVVISGRYGDTVETVVAELSARFDGNHIFGHPCDVTSVDQVQALWDAALSHFGRVDMWINNAGINHPQAAVHEQDAQLQQKVIDTNIIGTVNGAAVAARGMLEQGSGSIYNMHGLGSDGRQVEGLAIYGTTKRAVDYLTRALVKEHKSTPILIGSISPGMVVTDFLVGQFGGQPEKWAEVKPIFNILAERLETVTPWLADRILANRKHGAAIRYLNPARIGWRFLTARIFRRNIFADDGPPVGGL